MPVIRLQIEYDGTDYVGWQVQPNGASIQQVLESALHDLTGQDIRIHGSGRTDAGVHAKGQSAHFSTDSSIEPNKFAAALNSRLPDDISIRQSETMPAEFHSRFSACWKWYRYRIYNSPSPSPLHRRYSYRISYPLNLEAMQEAATSFQGEHDFRSFCAEPDRQSNTKRQLYFSQIRRQSDQIIYDCVGSGFLYNMVRVLVGTLISVGRGAMQTEEIAAIHDSGKRDLRSTTVPPQGLCMMKVGYEDFCLNSFETEVAQSL